jgi:hypothetical protein
MKGYVFVNKDGYRSEKDLRQWIELSLAFNSLAKAAKKAPSKKKSVKPKRAVKRKK